MSWDCENDCYIGEQDCDGIPYAAYDDDCLAHHEQFCSGVFGGYMPYDVPVKGSARKHRCAEFASMHAWITSQPSIINRTG